MKREDSVKLAVRLLKGSERVCAECGKIFHVSNPSDYVYKLMPPQGGTPLYYCRYTHWRQVLDRKERNKKNKSRGL